MPPSTLPRHYRVGTILSVFVIAYVAAGRLGLLLAVPPGYATAIFPPAGLAVGAMFIFGAWTLPAAFFGSLILNVWVGIAAGNRPSVVWSSALVIACASTLQAAVGGGILRKSVGYPAPLDNARDLTRFLVLTPVICLVSGSLSLSGLFLIGAVQSGDLATSWMTWWIGDTLGVLIVIPLLLVMTGEPRALWRRRARFVAAPMLLFFALFIAIFVRVSKWEEQQSLLEFRLQAQYLGDSMRTSLEGLGTLLDQLKSGFESRSLPVTQHNFIQMVSAVSERFPTVQAIEWAPLVNVNDRSAFERSQQVSLPSFALREADVNGAMRSEPMRPRYYPVTFLVPRTGNEQAMGFDLASNAARREAIESATSSQHVTATSPIRLVQEREHDSGVLLLDAVPSGATGPGVLVIVLRMGTFVRAKLGSLASSIDATLIDTATRKPLFNTLPPATKALSVLHFAFGDRRYALAMAPTPLYLAQHRGWQSWVLLVAGVFGTGLIGALLMLGTGQTWRFEALFEERSRDLKRSHERLRQEMAERERAQAALGQSQRMRAIGQLTGGIAHDFNNLLMVVSGSVERLRRDVSGNSAGRYLDMIGVATQRAENLTRQLLSFAQLRPLKPRIVDIALLTRTVCEMIRQSLRGDIEVRLGPLADVCAAQIDPGEFELALLNLAVNAQDAMPRGGILTVGVERMTLDEPLDGVAGECLAIRVADSGSGIGADILPRVFEPFFTTKDIGKGSGLGLSQVYGFARQSGGTVTIASEPGRGTTVILVLPASAESLAESSPSKATELPAEPTASTKALVVEDDNDVADILVAQLEGLGHRVWRVDNGRAALDAIVAESEFDILVSDILMPGDINGLELAREVRARYPRIDVLLVTGYGGSDFDPTGEGFAVLRKPFDTRALAEAISGVRSERIDRRRREDVASD